MPAFLGCFFHGQAWPVNRLDPSAVAARYTADNADEVIPEGVAVLVRDNFVARISCSRRDAVDDFRTTATRWGIPFDDIEADVSLWHGDVGTNVPIASTKRLEPEISDV